MKEDYNKRRARFLRLLISGLEKDNEYVISWHYRFDQYRAIADKMWKVGILKKVSKRGLDTYTKGLNFHNAKTFH